MTKSGKKDKRKSEPREINQGSADQQSEMNKSEKIANLNDEQNDNNNQDKSGSDEDENQDHDDNSETEKKSEKKVEMNLKIMFKKKSLKNQPQLFKIR